MVATSRPLSTEKQLHTQRQMPHIASTIIPFRGPKDKRGGMVLVCVVLVCGAVYGLFSVHGAFLSPCGARPGGLL